MSMIGGAIGGKKAAKYEKGFMGDAMAAQESAIKAMLELQAQGMDVSEDMFATAMQQMQGVGPAARQQLLAQGKRAEAKAVTSSLGQGLTGTTAHSGFLRGVTRDAGQNLAQLEQGLASTKAGMYERRGSEVYQQYIDRANIRQRTKYDPFLANYKMGSMTAAGAASGSAMGSAIGQMFSMYGASQGWSGFGGGGGAAQGTMGGYA